MMSNLLLKYKFLLVLMVFILGYGTWWLMTVERRAIKDLTVEMEKAVESEDIGACLFWLADDYVDSYGYTRADVRKILNDVFKSLDDINVTIINRRMMISDESALVTIVFKVVGTVDMGMRGYVAGNLNQPAEIVVKVRRNPEGWRITGVSRFDSSMTK